MAVAMTSQKTFFNSALKKILLSLLLGAYLYRKQNVTIRFLGAFPERNYYRLNDDSII